MNTGCQKEHWKVHKSEHRKIKKALDSVKNKGEENDDPHPHPPPQPFG